MARKTTGSLFTRGKAKNYYLRYCLDGKDYRIALKDESGQPITKQEAARIEADKILNAIVAKDKAQRFRNVLNEMQTAEKKAEDAERNIKNSSATIENGWRLFMGCPKRPASCKRFPVDEIPRHTTAANYQSYYKRFTAWLEEAKRGARLLSDITIDDASCFMDEIRRSGASGTFNKYLQFLNCFFDTLIEAKKITAENPFKEIDREAHRYNSKKPLTVEQIASLIDSASDDMRLLIALGYFTGLRMGDCCTLQWREVDLLRGVIERIPRKTENTIKDPLQAVVKIGIPQFLYNMLVDIPESERGVFLLPKFAEKYLAGGDQQITKWILKHFQSCGISIHRPGTGVKTIENSKTGEKKKVGSRAIVEIGFHSLRYSYISHNAEAGTPASVIQQNAGHANPAMTEHYTRISDHAAKKYAEALQLPLDVKAVGVISENSEREELQKLLDRLPLEKIVEILKYSKQIAKA